MSDSDADVLSHFSVLDELIQLIYQGAEKFVVLSAADDDSWTVHVGLSSSDDGRWWKGSWQEKDVRKFVGQKTSSIVLESFAERLAQTFVQGDLEIGGWSSEKDAEISLTLGPTAKTPIRISLSELSSEEAAAYAVKMFTDIALQAKSRKSRLHPPAFASAPVAPVAESSTRARTPPPAVQHKRKADPEPVFKSPKQKKKHKQHHEEEDTAAQEKIKALEAELAAQKKIASNAINVAKNSTEGLTSKAKTASSSAARQVKGASLANPNKKARKYQAVEFESDDD